MKILKATLIAALKQQVQQCLAVIEQFRLLQPEILQWRQHSGAWSILECLEHLNRYGDFYIPELDRQIRAAAKKGGGDIYFRPGLLGDYFAKMMLPGEKMKKMSTFKSMNPLHTNLSTGVITIFIQQQEQLLDLLDQAEGVDWNRTKTAISISKWIKLKLGDTFRVVIYHETRHLQQARAVLASYRTQTSEPVYESS